MTSESKDIATEVAHGAALLAAGLETAEVSKSAELEKAAPPFVKEMEDKKDDAEKDKKDKDVEKGMDAEDVEKAVEKAIEKALAPILAALNTVQKGLDVVDGKVGASLAHQSASTTVLMGLKEATVESVQVSKASAIVVDAIAAQPAGRKTADLVDVAKSATVEKMDIDMDRLREVSKGMETYEWITLKKQVQSGDYSGLTSGMRTQLGLKGEK